MLPPVRRVSKGAPVSLDVIEAQMRDLLTIDAEKTREWFTSAIYDRVAVGLCLLKAQQMHLCLTVGRRSKKSGQLESAEGFNAWLGSKFPGFSRATAYNYINAARNCGLTSDDGLDAVEDMRAGQRLHDKTAKELYRLNGALKTPDKHIPEPPLNLVAQVWAATSTQLGELRAVREQMEPDQYGTICAALQQALEDFTGAGWVMTGDRAQIDGAAHGEVTAKRKGNRNAK